MQTTTKFNNILDLDSEDVLDFPTGVELYQKMVSEYNYEPIIKTAIREYGLNDEHQTNNLLNAFLQWFSLIPIVSKDKGYVMLNSKVDTIFHCFIMNTKFYREFCQHFLGNFVDHNPLDQPDDSMPFAEYVAYTIQLLKNNFGNQLNSEFNEWQEQLINGNWRISCLGECDDERTSNDTSKGIGMKNTGMARTSNNAPIIG